MKVRKGRSAGAASASARASNKRRAEPQLEAPGLVRTPGASPLPLGKAPAKGGLIAARGAALGEVAKNTMNGPHIKARFERPDSYPPRAEVPDELVSWEKEFPGYSPPSYVAPSVIANGKPGGWADPEDFTKVSRSFKSYTGPLIFDTENRPLNPAGRTGMSGRGLLGKWGPNFAADPIVTRSNPQTGQFEMAAIRRKDSGEWAIPGGMVDEGEDVSATLAREFKEETGGDLKMDDAAVIYRGYADDRRNTDHAWMETTVKHKHLGAKEAALLKLEAGDDAAAVKWMPLTKANLKKLYGNHPEFVALALQQLK